jgi:endonuclease YncB( thermonuclease family)
MRIASRLAIGLFAIGLALAPAGAQDQAYRWRATGQTRVVDGDGLWLLNPVQVFCIDPAACQASNIVHPRGIEIRLHGIDAFELRQICTGQDGKPWGCGNAGKAYLTEIIKEQSVTCFGGGPGLGRDRYGREIAVCYLGPKNLNEEMVRQGLALAFRRYSDNYVEAENRAKAQGVGAWAGSFVTPWDWRRGVR